MSVIMRNSFEITGFENIKNFPENTLVIQVCFGGLGDHLFYSHLPRIAKETRKFKTVLLSNHSDFRNVLYKELIWQKNPYVDGFTDQAGWYPEVAEELPETNLLDTIMLAYGLDDGKRWHEPELYVDIPIRDDLVDKVIYDPNYITNAGRMGLKELRKYFTNNNIKVDYQLAEKTDLKSFLLNSIPSMSTKSFIDYCSIIKSCKQFYCLTSGGATLACALKKKAHVLHGTGIKSKFHHSKNNEYILIPADEVSFFDKLKRKILYYLKNDSYEKEN